MTFDRVVSLAQVFMLLAWEALGILAFGWPPVTIAACWFVGIWSYNILVATGLRTFFKIVRPPAQEDIHISSEDIGG